MAPSARSSLRFTLLQARNPGDTAREDELRAFCARLQVGVAQIRSVDILHDALNDSVLDGVDALLIGGAGEYSVVDPVPPVRGFIDFLSGVAERGFPLFASCFGFQALVVGMGGEVIADPEHAEVGTYDLELTDDGAGDPLFATLPRQFKAQLGHQDRVSRFPKSCLNLARSAATPYQALRLPELPVYATQFHPELTWDLNRARFLTYMSTYGRLFGEAQARAQLDGHVPSPESNRLLHEFVDRFVLQGFALQGGGRP